MLSSRRVQCSISEHGTGLNSDEIIVPSVSVLELRGPTVRDEFIDARIKNGFARKYGCLLVLKIPAYFLRTTIGASSSVELGFNMGIYVAQKLSPANIYSITIIESKPAFMETVRETERNAKRMDGLQVLIDRLESGEPVGAQFGDIDASTRGLRDILGITTAYFMSQDRAFRTKCVENGYGELHRGSITIVTGGTPITVRTSTLCLNTVIYHHRGDPQHWIIVPPSQKAAFEGRLVKEFRTQVPTHHCSQFARHLGIWIPPKILKRWDIIFFEVTMREKEFMVIFPHAYYWSWSEGFGILESKNQAGKAWDHSPYVECSQDSLLCGIEGLAEQLRPSADDTPWRLGDPLEDKGNNI